MDNYPGDLLAGVFPLVFAVDSTLSQEDAADQSSTRSMFDRFLDSMASSLVDEGDGTSNDKIRSGSELPLSFLLSGAEDDSSDEDDTSTIDSGSASKRFRMSLGSPTLGMPTMKALSRSGSKTTAGAETAYAKSLSTEGFFRRARINAISTKHGFPPSKDGEGQENRAMKLNQARSAMAMSPTKANAHRLQQVLDEHPIDGILPSGWLEKHVHALPSVLLVVAYLKLEDLEYQKAQDQHLLETIDHLNESLASKRDCHVRIVCLTEFHGDASMAVQINDWKARIQEETLLEISLLVVPDDLLPPAASPGANSSEAIRELQASLRNASWAYYQNQSRRAKRKLAVLGHEHQPNLLPLAVRYCFKIGIFYEFQLKHEKSLRYFNEAYRCLSNYYRHLQGKLMTTATDGSPRKAQVNPQSDQEIEASLAASPPRTPRQDDGGVEISLVTEGDGETKALVESSPPDAGPVDVRKYFDEMEHPPDMAHQCRAVADWLNFKLLQAGFLSSAFSQSEAGVLAASAQWRRHCQIFMKRDDPSNPAWNHFAYLAQQRQVMSQLVERYPPNEITSLTGLAKDEVLMRCSTWRNYVAAAEAILRLGAEVRKAQQNKASTDSTASDQSSLRGRYVGGFESEGLEPLLEEHAKVKHADVALEMLRRAIAMFESGAKAVVEAEQEDEKGEEYYHRRGVRLYYLAGGILLGKGQHAQAIEYLEKAVKYAAGWNGLELVIRRMLIECYEKHLPTQGSATKEQTNIIASMILDSYFNAEMPSRNLRRALKSFSSISGGEMIKWHCDCVDESDASLPFSFAVTFPSSTHAIAGDSVTASIIIRSNLDYAVHINSLILLSMAGDVPVPAMTLMSAENASEGTDGGIIVQGKKSILMTMQIDLPKGLDDIATDESGNGGEKQGVAGKGSFSKSARPRTAGITSAAGARFYSESKSKDQIKEKNGQWSLKQLGGKPFRSDGIRLVLYPVLVARAAAAAGGEITKQNMIELTIQKKKPKTAANIRRTPFEEDNYLASAWSRPQQLPLGRGPRCLRVLGPMSQMKVTNLTDPLTSGRALEGTVNRVLLKLKAGTQEICKDLKCTISCSSLLLLADGTTKDLTTQELKTDDNTDEDTEVKVDPPDIANVRLPILVSDAGRSTVDTTAFGYELPLGWTVMGAQRGVVYEQPLATPSLNPGQETFVSLDLYRPPAPLPTDQSVDESGSKPTPAMQLRDGDVCQTDFDVRITYKQARPRAQQARGRRRRPPPGRAAAVEDELEIVSLDYSGSVLWDSPISAEFLSHAMLKKGPPCGSRHPSNAMGDDETQKKDDSAEDGAKEVVLVDGEQVNMRCLLKAKDPSSDTKVALDKVWFQDVEGGQACSLLPVSEASPSYTILKSQSKDPSRDLSDGTKYGVEYSVVAKMNEGYRHGSATKNLGVVCIDWQPIAVEVPMEVKKVLSMDHHGPLRLKQSPTLKFHGPVCYIESSPFRASVSTIPSRPSVRSAFQLKIEIENTTSIHQATVLNVSDKDPNRKAASVADSIFVSGVVGGQINLSPFEKKVILLTAVALKSGKCVLPCISASSQRYKNWIINESKADRSIFVDP